MSSMGATFYNYSDATWQLNAFEHSGQGAFGGVQTAPGKVLRAFSGAESFEVTFDMSDLANGGEASASWWTGYEGRTIAFGVKIVQRPQIFTIGPRPVWYVMTSYDSGWIESGAEPGDPYTWEGLPYSIVATPTSTHQSLELSVAINPLNS